MAQAAAQILEANAFFMVVVPFCEGLRSFWPLFCLSYGNTEVPSGNPRRFSQRIVR
jgi:hypothetical protein